jgi:hypothetical protein
MLANVMPRKEIPKYLATKYPGRVEFENHQSLYTNWGFSSEQIQKLVLFGAAGIWEESEPSIVINPLRVVISAGKERLIVNARVLNAFLRALSFRYQKLRDILAFTERGSFMATWDLKSGYFHVPIHPAFRKYFAFKVGGITFYFKVLCFGFSQACFVFTKVMQEPAFELRKRGIPLSDYIDDAFTAANTINRCARQSALSALFFGALGAFLGLPKCHLKPEQLMGWLGFIVDSLEEQILISESKVQKIKLILADTIRDPSTTPRKLAKLAGKLVSISPAVLPAALFSRCLFEAMQGKVSWDAIFPTTVSVRQTAEFWIENLDRLNGRRWWPRKEGLSVRVDASNVEYGGTFSFDSSPVVLFAGTFTEGEATESSTEGEMRGYVAALKVASQQFPQKLAHSSMQLTGDNQGAISALNKLRSSVTEINNLLKQVFDICLCKRMSCLGGRIHLIGASPIISCSKQLSTMEFNRRWTSLPLRPIILPRASSPSTILRVAQQWMHFMCLGIR